MGQQGLEGGQVGDTQRTQECGVFQCFLPGRTGRGVSPRRGGALGGGGSLGHVEREGPLDHREERRQGLS